MRPRRNEWIHAGWIAASFWLASIGSAGPSPEVEAYRLLERRLEAREKTEVEVDLPPRCVVTGLGARAHADNLTTLHVQYREVLADGSLGPPREARAGAEPDHACEAKVLLPDGWVVVGFGARGAPEWDVATLRVWGRPWRGADGPRGEPRAWSDGREPEAGLERVVEPTDAGRALVGVGLRFHQNDIQGIYARSARIVPVPAGRRSLRRAPSAPGVPCWGLRPPTVGPIALGALDPDRLQAEILERFRLGADRVFVDDEGVEGTAAEPIVSVCEELLDDPFRPADEALRAAVSRRVDAGHVETVVRALSRVPALRRLTFSAAGAVYLGSSGGLPTPEEAPDLVEDAERAIDREKETARWLLVQSRAEIDAVLSDRETPWLRLVAADLELYDRAISLWGDLARADAYSRRFLVDGAASTHAAAVSAADRIGDMEIPRGFGDPSPLLARVRERLRTPEARTSLGRRLAEIEKAAASPSPEAASRAAALLVELLEQPDLARALDRHWTRIGDLASAVRAFGHDASEVRVRWGGDGRWTAAVRGGRWAWVTTARGPCVYLDVAGAPDRAAVRFEVLDEAEGRVDVHYSSVDPSTGERNDYRAASPVPLTGAGEWRVVTVPLEDCAFFGRQNLEADLRLIPNLRGVAIRAVRIEPVASPPDPEGES